MSLFSERWTDWKNLYAARNEPENIRPLAELYWRALIGIGLFLIVCIIVWGVWVFFAVITSLSSASAATSQTPPIGLDRNKLQQTVSVFQARASAFDAAQAAPATAQDPSK